MSITKNINLLVKGNESCKRLVYVDDNGNESLLAVIDIDEYGPKNLIRTHLSPPAKSPPLTWELIVRLYYTLLYHAQINNEPPFKLPDYQIPLEAASEESLAEWFV